MVKNLQNRRNIGDVKLSKSDRPPVAKAGGSSFDNKSGGRGGKKSGVKAPVTNPFDKFPNAKKKFEVLNLRVQGGERNVGRARQRAIDVRESRLTDEYRGNKKSNSFIDRRFGESDASLTVEDKMAIRFQKEKIRKTKASSVFNLDAPLEMLTHKGKVLSEDSFKKGKAVDASDAEDSDDELGKDIVNTLHFGGGFVKKASAANPDVDGSGPGGPMSHLSALDKVIANSKLMKAQKKEEKEEDEDERLRLDNMFDDLVKESAVSFRPKKYDRELDGKYVPDAYDISVMEISNDGDRLAASDRTKTPEEIALEAKTKLEALEKERLKRMRGDTGGNDDLNDDEEEVEDEDDDENEDDDDDDDDDSSSADSGSDGSGDDEEEEEDDGDDDDDDDEEDEEDDDDEDDDRGYHEILDKNSSAKSKKGDESAKKNVSFQNASESKSKASKSSSSKAGGGNNTNSNSGSDVNPLMPHNLDCPADIVRFDELADEYVKSPGDMKALIERILIWNSTHLPGAEGKKNKEKMHNFLDVLLKIFMRVGDSLSIITSEANAMDLLDFLTREIFKLSQDLADIVPQLWGRLIKVLENQLQKRLRDYEIGQSQGAFPSLGKILLFRLLGTIFSVSDFRHAVVLPASLFLCQCLTQCPVTNLGDVSSGLLISSILLEYSKESERYIPEVLTFVTSVLGIYVKQDSTAASTNSFESSLVSKTFNMGYELGRQRASCSTISKSSDYSLDKIGWVTFSTKGEGNTSSDDAEAGSFGCNCLHTAYKLLDTLVSRFHDSLAFPEIFTPALYILRQMRPQEAPKLPLLLQQMHLDCLNNIIQINNTQISSRKPLQARKVGVSILDSKAPKYESEFKMNKNMDPDPERAQYKQLKRQLKREEKAAVREIRRDSEFLDQVRNKEKNALHNKRKNERHKNFASMEGAQAVLNEQARKDKDVLRGGGSGVVKRRKI